MTIIPMAKRNVARHESVLATGVFVVAVHQSKERFSRHIISTETNPMTNGGTFFRYVKFAISKFKAKSILKSLTSLNIRIG